MARARLCAFLLPALALAVGLMGYTCAPSPSEYDDYSAYSAETEQSTKGHKTSSAPSVTSATHAYAQYAPLTPSQYIRDFVESVFRGEADTELEDSGERLRPINLPLANPGFNQYWPQGEWAVTKAELDFCNTSADACSVLYKNYGKLCASDMHDKHDTFNDWCELNDDNCRDGTVTLWTETDKTKLFKWFRVSQSPVFVNVRQKIPSHIVISSEKGFPSNALYYTISLGIWDFKVKNYSFNINSRHSSTSIWDQSENWPPIMRRYINDTQFADLTSDKVQLLKIEFSSTSGWIGLTVMKNPLFIPDSYPYVQFNLNEPVVEDERNGGKIPFDMKYIGFGGGTEIQPTWWHAYGLGRAWLPVYRGPCQPPLATMPTEIPDNIREKMNIDLYNFAGRMDEFGYNYTRIGKG